MHGTGAPASLQVVVYGGSIDPQFLNEWGDLMPKDELGIPQLPRERVLELSARMRPVYMLGGGLSYMKPVDEFRTAFTWDPDPDGPAEGLSELARIRTRHTCGYHGFFKPSIEEVVSQIPKDMLDRVVAFRTIAEEGGDDGVIILRGGRGHEATTVLYGREP
jgi:hypothetical protein